MKTNVLNFVEASARAYPNKVAVVDGSVEYTYGELVEASKRIGSALLRLNVQRKGVVVLMEKSTRALSVLLGIVYAGGFYVPVDVSVPAKRLAHIVAMLDNPVIVYDESVPLEGVDSCISYRAIQASSLENYEINEAALQEVRAQALEIDPVYTLFTSGSTGEPKGVVINHRSIVTFIDAFVDELGITFTDRIGNQAPFDFDVSTKDIYATFAVSATLVLIPMRLFMRPSELIAFLESKRITVLIWAVAALCLVSSYHALDVAQLGCLRSVMFCGEVMPLKHLNEWRTRYPQVMFVNLYGPSEVTCNCLYHVLDPARDYSNGIPLGKPFSHCEVMLIDSNKNLATRAGEIGEIVVRSPSLSLGYIKDTEQTNRVFVQNPVQDQYRERVYCTGDLAQINENGELIFYGRKDNQIKYLGHRIELEEIELTLERVEGVSRCKCLFDSHKKRLLAFYEGVATSADIAAFCRDNLPKHMHPTSIKHIEAMPMNKNGKVDKTALQAMFSSEKR